MKLPNFTLYRYMQHTMLLLTPKNNVYDKCGAFLGHSSGMRFHESDFLHKFQIQFNYDNPTDR